MFVIMTVCMMANSKDCRETRVEQSVEERPPISCIVEGQNTVAVWQQEHPKWTVARWACVPRSRLDQPL